MILSLCSLDVVTNTFYPVKRCQVPSQLTRTTQSIQPVRIPQGSSKTAPLGASSAPKISRRTPRSPNTMSSLDLSSSSK